MLIALRIEPNNQIRCCIPYTRRYVFWTLRKCDYFLLWTHSFNGLNISKWLISQFWNISLLLVRTFKRADFLIFRLVRTFEQADFQFRKSTLITPTRIVGTSNWLFYQLNACFISDLNSSISISNILSNLFLSSIVIYSPLICFFHYHIGILFMVMPSGPRACFSV